MEHQEKTVEIFEPYGSKLAIFKNENLFHTKKLFFIPCKNSCQNLFSYFHLIFSYPHIKFSYNLFHTLNIFFIPKEICFSRIFFVSARTNKRHHHHIFQPIKVFAMCIFCFIPLMLFSYLWKQLHTWSVVSYLQHFIPKKSVIYLHPHFHSYENNFIPTHVVSYLQY